MPETASKPLFLCYPFVKAALVTGKFKYIVQQPKYTDVNEWVAMNLSDFFSNINLFLSFTSESCTVETCPTMSISSSACYPWIEKNGRMTELPAPQHIDYILTWIQNTLDDQSIFPTRFALEFSSDFPAIAKAIYRQMLHIFAHLYYAHYPVFLHMSCEAHFNSFFAHFVAFGTELNLLEPKELYSPAGELLGLGELVGIWRELQVLA
ncbi:Mob1/phocein [Clavulina sp. PMI_390]|nr:Mob1/phocein [Clavulina sp. PMI_390]